MMTGLVDRITLFYIIFSCISSLQGSPRVRHKRATVISNQAGYWPQGKIPYVLNADLDSNVRAKVMASFTHIQMHTCVQFVPNSNSVAQDVGHTRYVEIRNSMSGSCSSAIGKGGDSGVQYINLAASCGNNDRTPVHELGHTLGLTHEHQRPDRNSYVTVHSDNILTGRESQFTISSGVGLDTSILYDVGSVMEYDGTLFQKSSSVRTLTPVNPLLALTHVARDNLGGNVRNPTDALSQRDKLIINKIYNCSASCSSPANCQNGGYLKSNCQCACPFGITGNTCSEIDVSNGYNSGCGGIITAISGTITSKNYPSPYSFGDKCRWLIKGSSPNRRIRVKITALDLANNCQFDFLWIYIFGPDVDHYQLSCVAQDKTAYLNQWVVSQQSFVTVDFFSSAAGGSPTQSGFSITYEIGCLNGAGNWVMDSGCDSITPSSTPSPSPNPNLSCYVCEGANCTAAQNSQPTECMGSASNYRCQVQVTGTVNGSYSSTYTSVTTRRTCQNVNQCTNTEVTCQSNSNSRVCSLCCASSNCNGNDALPMLISLNVAPSLRTSLGLTCLIVLLSMILNAMKT